jgi:methionine-rich copper-binding protein CopC
MKKIITLCLFVFALTLCTNNIAAQDITEIRAVSAAQTKVLRNEIKMMTSEQKEQVYETYKVYNTKKAALVTNGTSTTESTKKNKDELFLTMKKILNKEQFDIFQVIFKEN